MVIASGSSPSVSVVLCTFNGGAYLREQLESIVTQTLLPNEIIVSDDGSTDDTGAILEEFTPRAGSVGITWRVIQRASPHGAAKNFWATIPDATGDLIALADQDDIWRTDKLEVLLGRFASHPRASLVHSDAVLIDHAGRTIGSLSDALRVTVREKTLLTSGRGLPALVRRNLVTGATLVFARSLVQRAGALPDGWMHDEWLGLIAAAGGGLVWEPERLISYRQHGGNEIGARKSQLSDALARLREDRLAFLSKRRQRIAALEGLIDSAPGWLDASAARILQGKIAHERMRVGLPEERWRRFGAIARALAAGAYSRYSRGLFDALRDASLRPHAGIPTHGA